MAIKNTQKNNLLIFKSSIMELNIGKFARMTISALATISIYTAITLPTLAQGVSDQESHRAAIDQARQGNTSEALIILEEMLNRYPNERQYQYDYITILAWAGRDADAYAILPKLNLQTTPVYVLESLAKSARNTKHYSDAAAIYQAAIKTDPNRLQSYIGLALTLTDDGQIEAALQTLSSLPEKNRTSLEVLQAKLYAYEANQDFLKALLVHEEILALYPNSPHATRNRILTISKLGAPQVALTLAAEYSYLLTDTDLAAIKNDQAVQSIRWGRLDQLNPLHRYDNTDAAINHLIGEIHRVKQSSGGVPNRLYFDLLVAYRDRKHMHEAVIIFEELTHKNVALPAYVLTASATAYLYLRQPEKSIPLLKQSLQISPNNIEAEETLFYSLLESGQYNEAINFIDKISASKRDWIKPAGSNSKVWNAEKIHLDITAALARAFTGNLQEAQQRLETLQTLAPNNTGIKNELAHIYLWRGWPRLALSKFKAINTLEPDYLGAQLGVINAQYAIGNVANAEKLLTPIQTIYYDEQSVRRAARDLETFRQREIFTYISGGDISSNQDASKEFNLDTYYYDLYLNKYIRPFVHASYQQGTLSNVATDIGNIGIGADYTAKDINARAEVYSDTLSDTGLLASGSFQVNDYLKISAALDSNSRNIPLRARIDRISAKSAQLSANYRLNELSNISAQAVRTTFSDGNTRNSQLIAANQRLIQKIQYSLDVGLHHYNQSNTKINTSYFNPESASTTAVKLANEWLSYRRYDKSFSQRLALSAGSMRQQGYSSGNIWGIDYEHAWSFDSRTFLSYGLSYGTAYYDGASETATRGFMMFNRRF